MIACLTIAYFAAAVERRENEALAQTPLVVGGQPWEPRPLFGLSLEVARRGVQPGMPLRQAHLLSPDSHFLPAAPPRYLDATGEVVDVLADFTPLIAPEELWQPLAARKGLLPAGARTLPARYTVDLEALPQKEALPLVQEMGRTVRRHTRLEPAVGLAADPFTAQVAAALAAPNHVRLAPPGEEQSFLAGRPLSFLPLEKEMARRLRLLGICTLGQFARLPPSALQAQFGCDAQWLYRLARGEGVARIAAPPAAAQEAVQRHFEPPLVNWLAVRDALSAMAQVLAGRLATGGLAGRRLCLLIEMEEGAPRSLALPLRRPASTAGRLAQAAQELAQGTPVTAAITALTLSLGELQPAGGRQLSLFEQQPPDEAGERLEAARARHPAAHFWQPSLVDGEHPLPERRFELQPVG